MITAFKQDDVLRIIPPRIYIVKDSEPDLVT
jgi:hypothetical protein